MAPDIFNVPPEQGKPDDPKRDKPTPEEQELIDRFAKWVVQRSLTVPAIMGIESFKPMNWIASQGMLVTEPAAWALEPMLKAAFKFSHKDYLTMQRLLEYRWAPEAILQTIEKFDDVQRQKEDEVRKEMKARKKALKSVRKEKRKKFFRKLFGNEKPEDLK